MFHVFHVDFPGGSDGKSVCLQCGRPGFSPWVGKIPWRRKWQPSPVLSPGKSHGWRSLVGYSPRGRKESDKTEQLHFHFSFLSSKLVPWASQVALVIKNLPASARDVEDVGWILGSGRSPGIGNDSPLQHSCLKHLMGTGASRTIVGSQRVRHN